MFPMTPQHPAVSATARAGARRIARRLRNSLGGFSPRSEVATVVDTSFHHSQGYITCTSGRGPIMVVGVPYLTVVPGMRIFLRRITHQGQTSFIYDGLATPAMPFNSSGSLSQEYGQWPAATSASTYGGTSYAGPYLLLPNTAPVKGWFWSFYFYVSALPKPGAPATLLDMPILNGSFNTVVGGIRFLYDVTAHVGVEVYGSGWGDLGAQSAYYNVPCSPQTVWWLNYTLGGVGMSLNAIQYTAGNSAINGLGSTMTTGPANQAVGLYLLSDSSGGFGTHLGGEGAVAAPAASWISKVTFGAKVDGGGAAVSPVSFVVDPADDATVSAAHDLVPTADNALIDLSNVTYGGAQYLCGNSTPGGTTLVDNSGHGFDLTVTSGTIHTFGPY